MRNLGLTVVTLMFSIQAFAEVPPTSVKSAITQIMRSRLSQEKALSVTDLCHLMRPNNKELHWGKAEFTLKCTHTPQGLVQIAAENSLGQVSVFANPTDITLVEEFDGDYSYEYLNDLDQRLYLKLTYKKDPSGETAGFYTADLSLRDRAAKIRIGYSYKSPNYSN